MQILEQSRVCRDKQRRVISRELLVQLNDSIDDIERETREYLFNSNKMNK